MRTISTEWVLIGLCGLVVLSYLFSILGRKIRVPSVLLLLLVGIILRLTSNYFHQFVAISGSIVEALGVVGLIMIILEAGLDLELRRSKLKMVRNSFFSALVILVLSAALITTLLHYWLGEPVRSCIVYALPLSIMSSSIVIPSIHHFTPLKKEFLVYEASFSDILGILFFNYFIGQEVLSGSAVAVFGLNIVVALVLSLLLSLALFYILTQTRLDIKFFLIFALLILIYSGGKLLHLPSLLIILTFGLLIRNWSTIQQLPVMKRFAHWEGASVQTSLHSITAETSFLVRTFFFILFGYSIDLRTLAASEVWTLGGLIVAALFVTRLLYFRFFLRARLFPESFFIPRGLITIVLFYKIPETLKLSNFNDGILFFVILSTGLIMTGGMVFYKTPAAEVLEEPQFSERNDLV